ncbi:uncharacterized protein EI97DRAFT_155832 [Westerdykella ornata]|uniref:Uncharacterized protein n=1 Tax=Westerdykella ornata TaxID=318751 RepID=A0A6A6JBL9_WESOR|nr:uncharacterized protein EI97DRAFT_155832 [Westerdykella ornata]KAF2273388.1 hypothetical protein EI97DRAFT_155832 [Westerdykella ornata]
MAVKSYILYAQALIHALSLVFRVVLKMMLRGYVLIFFASLFLLHVFAVDLVPIQDPIKPDEILKSVKRDPSLPSFTGNLDLQDVETFFWGAPAGDKLVYANLTVYFPETYEYVIALERFADTLKSVACSENMMLEFIDKAAFDYAKSVWQWVSDDVNNSFVLVSNHEKCADDMERQPFIVSDIRYDDEHNKAYLTADLKEWDEVMHSYTLHVGNMPLTPVHRMLMERGIMKRDADFTMDLTSGYDQRLFSASGGGWTASVDAVIRTVGSLNVDIDLDVEWFSIKSASMSINPDGLAASLQLALSAEGTLREAYPWKKTVLSLPVQGLNLKNIIKLGAFLDIDVGFTMEEWAGEARANFGARMEISNAAIAKVDLVDSKNNAFSGWAPSFSQIPLNLNAKIEGSARAYAEPNIKLEASALRWGWNVALGMQMPYLSADFAAMYDTTGVCDSKKTLGVDVGAKVGIEVHAQAATKGNEASPFWEQEIFAKEWNLLSTCLPFGANNAKTGEAADPNPAPKTRKSKTKSKSKASKSSKASKTPAPTNETKTTKTAKSSTVRPTPRPTPAASSARATKDLSKSRELEPTKTSSKLATTAKSTTSRTTRVSDTDGSRSRKPANSGGEDPSSTTSVNISKTSDAATSSTFSTLRRNSTGTKDDTQTTSDSDIVPSSATLSTSRRFNVTAAPSSQRSATATSSALSSTSSADSCPASVLGCAHCKDSLDMDDRPTREYFAVEVEGGSDFESNSTELRKRETREYTYTCSHITETVTMAPYPAFRNWKTQRSKKITEFYLASDTGDCLNHGISKTSSPASPVPTGDYAMEHVSKNTVFPKSHLLGTISFHSPRHYPISPSKPLCTCTPTNTHPRSTRATGSSNSSPRSRPPPPIPSPAPLSPQSSSPPPQPLLPLPAGAVPPPPGSTPSCPPSAPHATTSSSSSSCKTSTAPNSASSTRPTTTTSSPTTYGVRRARTRRWKDWRS